MSLTKRQKSRAVWGFFVVVRPFLLETGTPALCRSGQGGKRSSSAVCHCHPPAGPTRGAPAAATLPAWGVPSPGFVPPHCS